MLTRKHALLFLFFFVFSAVRGEEEPAYNYRADFRLAHAAASLGLPAERLLKARVALRKPTEEIDIITPHGGASLGPLIVLWKRIDPESLPGAFALLFEKLRQEALTAARPFAYDWSTLGATLLLSELAAVVLEEAISLGRQWPPPAPHLGERSQARYGLFWDKIVSKRLGELAKDNPDKAAVAVARIQNPLDFSVRGEMAASLHRRGRVGEAHALAREVIADYRASDANRELFLDFALFVRHLVPVSDTLFLEAWALALQKLYSGDQTNRFITGKDGHAVGFTGAESVLLSKLQYHPRAPRILESILKSFPELKARLERIGGIQALWNSTTRRFQPIGSATQSASDAEATLAAPTISLKGRAVAAVTFLRRMQGRAILPEQSARLRRLLDELRTANHAELLYPGRGVPEKPEIRIELELLMLWCGHDFEDAVYRAENVSDRDFRSLVLRRMAEHLASNEDVQK